MRGEHDANLLAISDPCRLDRGGECRCGVQQLGWCSRTSLSGVIAWALTVLLLIGSFAVVGWLPTGNPPISDWRGVLIDQRNKISLSRFQLVLWSLLVIATIIVEGILNAVWGVKNPLQLSVPPQMWILLGLSSGFGGRGAHRPWDETTR
jgi:hypothetical protein